MFFVQYLCVSRMAKKMNNVYHRYWLQFAKQDAMKFIGHLDLLRIFQQSIRRAQLPVAYSMGFNPHQRLSFAMPLPVGMAGTAEWAEILLDSPFASDVLQAALNPVLPHGLQVTAVYSAPGSAPRLAPSVMAADYTAHFPEGAPAGLEAAVAQMLAAPEILMEKKTKSGTREVDIRPDIFGLAFLEGALHMRLATGSAQNLNPQLVLRALSRENAVITRIGLLACPQGVFVPLHTLAAQ